MKKIILFCCLFVTLFIFSNVSAQISWTPAGPGCAGSAINFTTSELHKVTYQWDFSNVSVNLASLPALTTLPSIGPFSSPAFTCFIQDQNGDYHLFVTEYSTQNLYRVDYPGTLYTTPIVTLLGSYGTAGILEGIDVAYDEGAGEWYGVMVNGSELFQIDFGPGAGALYNNSPTITSTTFPTMYWPHQATIKYYNDGTSSSVWHAFVGDRNSNLLRFDFATNLASSATMTVLPNAAGAAYPCNFTLFYQAPDWYAVVPDLIDGTIYRYDFGTDLLNNVPTGTELIDQKHQNLLDLPRGISLLQDCQGDLVAYQVNETGNMTKLDFSGDITNNPSFVNLGATGGAHLNCLAPCAHDNMFSLLIPDYSGGTIDIFDPFISLTPNEYLNYYNPNQTNSFAASGTYPISLFLDMGRQSGPSLECAKIEIDSCPPPCYDSNKTVLKIIPKGQCTFDAIVNVATSNIIMGYTWNVEPSGVTQTDITSSPSDNFVFSTMPGVVYTVTVTIHIVDSSLNCCTGVLTQTVTCNKGPNAEKSAGNTTINPTNASDHTIAIFPNPTDDAVVVSSTKEGITEIQVIDVNGTKVGDCTYGNTNTANVSLAGLPPGSYLFKINNKTSQMVMKK